MKQYRTGDSVIFNVLEREIHLPAAEYAIRRHLDHAAVRSQWLD